MKIQITRYLDFFFKPQVCVALSNEISGLQFPDIKIGIRTANITEDFPQLWNWNNSMWSIELQTAL